VAPGYVATDLLAKTMATGGFTAEEIAARTPLRRLAEPEEVAPGGRLRGLRRGLLHHRLECAGGRRMGR
jgi:NAD(P)-dependent dehydrogenase (short-subunit alcohol dehydrogenase family)